jgi:FkbM family methyltransferase
LRFRLILDAMRAVFALGRPGRLHSAGRTAVRRLLRATGFEKIHHPSIVDLMLHEGVRHVLDVGANEGQFGRDIRERGYRGHITSFEPVSTAFEALRRRAEGDRLWDVHRLGVGQQPGEAVISVTTATVFSSFKPPSAYTATTFAGAQEARRETVPMVRLDHFVAARRALLDATYLKIDTQGFEKEVLLGLGDHLPRMKAVQMELPLRLLYEEQATLVEMVEWMGARGFEIAMVKENGFDWNAMRLLELDLVFVRT